MDIVERMQWLEALGAKDTDMLRLYIEADPDKVNAHLAPEHRPGYVPLHAVAEIGHVPALDLLIKHGADVNLADGAGFTPLHTASEYGNAAIVSRLLSAGADVHTPRLLLMATRPCIEY
jgi:ankyrin repeat protein